MKFSETQQTIQRSLEEIYKKQPLVKAIVTALHTAGAQPFLVGGAVRDTVLQRPLGDLDIEVFGCSIDALEAILKKFGIVRLVGKQFGVLRIDHLDIDFSLPRVDAPGRKPAVTINEQFSLKEACKRRDLTMNAMAIDLVTGALHDPYRGLQALADRVLRAPDLSLFIEDPLRFFRIMQFAARFDMSPDQALTDVCKKMDLSGISLERIAGEYEKLFLYGGKPSRAFRWLAAMERLDELLPELGATQGCAQRPDYHPEGDVFEHSMQAVDGAAQRVYESEEKRMIIVLAALCHDLGKVVTTRLIDGVLRSNGHAHAGVPLAEQMLNRMGVKLAYRKGIARLIHYHMDPVAFIKNSAGPGAYKRLAHKLAPDVTITDLYRLCCCDKAARNPESHEPLQGAVDPLLEQFMEQAKKYRVDQQPEDPLITGADLLDHVPAGPLLGTMLRKAYEIQIDEGITDKEELKKRIMKQ